MEISRIVPHTELLAVAQNGTRLRALKTRSLCRMRVAGGLRISREAGMAMPMQQIEDALS
jgi:hypothetical protein